jgi:hypothetical protein
MRRWTFLWTFVLLAFIVCGAAAGEWYVSLAEGPDEVVCKVPSVEPSTVPRWIQKAQGKKRRKGGLPDDGDAQQSSAGSQILDRLPGIPEASGLALSRRTPGILWTFNDSHDPTIYAIDRDGMRKGQVRVRGVMTRNWEDISAGRCGQRWCLYIADIGDNHMRRADITVYRVPEPKPTDTDTAPAEAFTATYPDGPHDAEGLFVTPDEGLFLVTKDKPSVVYRFPQPLEPGHVASLQEVALLPVHDATDAETSPDGVWVGIRTKEEMLFFRTLQLTSGGTEHGTPINLRGLQEPQGEGIAIAGDGTVYLAGEGGDKRSPGTFIPVTCTFPKTTNSQRPTSSSQSSLMGNRESGAGS